MLPADEQDGENGGRMEHTQELESSVTESF